MACPSDTVVAEIQYLNPDPIYDDERPYAIASEPPPGLKRTNIVQQGVKTLIHSARGHENEFTLYTSGFEWVHHPLSYAVSLDENVDRYMADMESLLQRHLKAAKVVVYDFVIRQQRDKDEDRAPGVPRKVKKQIFGAHLDISRESAMTRIRLKCKDEAEELLQQRWHIINIWRPLNGPVRSAPLALCDSRSLSADDIVESDIVLPHLQIQAYEIWYNPDQSWHYLPQQSNDEVLLMLSCDSETDTRCAHTAFEDPNTVQGDPKRHSIELRCMIFQPMLDAGPP